MSSKCIRLRFVWLASLALLASSGCRTGGLGNLAGPAPPVMPRTSPDARRLLADHNRNAARIRTINAQPSISVSAGRWGGGLDGMLAMERPRNFKLRLKHTGGEVADIGSNDEEFWIWTKETKESRDKFVYYCNYDGDGNCPLAGAGGLQPDWIIEALGLRVVPEEEMDEITVTRGKEPDTLVLTHRPTRTGAGEAVTRVTFLTESTRQVKEYQLWTGDRKTKLAYAQIKQYLPIVPSDGSEPVYVPQKLRLEWIREKLAMEATFFKDKVTVNTPFSEEFRAAVFVEPTPPGYARKDLAREAGIAGHGPSTTIRETLPAPPSGSGVQLGEPEDPAPIGTEAASRTPRDPIALSADLRAVSSLSSQVVGAPIPRPPVPEFQSGNWRPVAGPSYER